MNLDIGEVVRASGLPASTLHVWERRGLITPIGRSGIRRQYDASVFDRIATVLVMQRSGFNLAEISELLADDAFDSGKELLTAKLAQLDAQRRALDVAIEGLQHALECEATSPLTCPGFLQHLEGLLPVDQSQRLRSPRSP